jgi:hypothetical protein
LEEDSTVGSEFARPAYAMPFAKKSRSTSSIWPGAVKWTNADSRRRYQFLPRITDTGDCRVEQALAEFVQRGATPEDETAERQAILNSEFRDHLRAAKCAPPSPGRLVKK